MKPACEHAASLAPGDRLVEVAGRSVAGLPTREAMGLLEAAALALRDSGHPATLVFERPPRGSPAAGTAAPARKEQLLD